jgi:hypothetical protein
MKEEVGKTFPPSRSLDRDPVRSLSSLNAGFRRLPGDPLVPGLPGPDRHARDLGLRRLACRRVPDREDARRAPALAFPLRLRERRD